MLTFDHQRLALILKAKKTSFDVSFQASSSLKSGCIAQHFIVFSRNLSLIEVWKCALIEPLSTSNYALEIGN